MDRDFTFSSTSLFYKSLISYKYSVVSVEVISLFTVCNFPFIVKLKVAWHYIRERRKNLGINAIYLLGGLERNLQLDNISDKRSKLTQMHYQFSEFLKLKVVIPYGP